MGGAEKCHRITKSHGEVEFDEANEIAATSAAIAVEKILGRVHQEAGLVIGVQRTQSHQSPAGDAADGFPILRLQVVQQGICCLSASTAGHVTASLPPTADYARPQPNPRQGWWARAKKSASHASRTRRPSRYNIDSAICDRPNAATWLDLVIDWDLCTAEQFVPKRRHDGNSIPKPLAGNPNYNVRTAPTKQEGW